MTFSLLNYYLIMQVFREGHIKIKEVLKVKNLSKKIITKEADITILAGLDNASGVSVVINLGSVI